MGGGGGFRVRPSTSRHAMYSRQTLRSKNLIIVFPNDITDTRALFKYPSRIRVIVLSSETGTERMLHTHTYIRVYIYIGKRMGVRLVSGRVSATAIVVNMYTHTYTHEGPSAKTIQTIKLGQTDDVICVCLREPCAYGAAVAVHDVTHGVPCIGENRAEKRGSSFVFPPRRHHRFIVYPPPRQCTEQQQQPSYHASEEPRCRVEHGCVRADDDL